MLLTHPLPDYRITDARQRALNYPVRPIPPNLNFELAKARLMARYEGETKSNITFFENQLQKKRYLLKPAAQYGLALSYFEDKQLDKALFILESLRQSHHDNLFYVDALTDVYIANGQPIKAINMLKQLNLFMPNNQVISLNYANALIKTNQFELAAEILQDFLLVNPENFIAYDLLTTLYQKQGNLGLMHMNKAEVFALLGGYNKAVDELQTSYSLLDELPLMQKRIKARILQFQEQENRLKRL
jgi:predicted Zn-dependent protease